MTGSFACCATCSAEEKGKFVKLIKEFHLLERFMNAIFLCDSVVEPLKGELDEEAMSGLCHLAARNHKRSGRGAPQEIYACRYIQDFVSIKTGLAAKPVYFRCCCLVLLLLKFLASKGGLSARKCMNGGVSD